MTTVSRHESAAIIRLRRLVRRCVLQIQNRARAVAEFQNRTADPVGGGGLGKVRISLDGETLIGLALKEKEIVLQGVRKIEKADRFQNRHDLTSNDDPFDSDRDELTVSCGQAVKRFLCEGANVEPVHCVAADQERALVSGDEVGITD